MWEVVYPTSRAVELDAEDDEEQQCLFESSFINPVVRLSNELQNASKPVSCELLVFALERISTAFVEAHFICGKNATVGLVSGGKLKQSCNIANSLRQTASSDKTCFIYGSKDVLFCQCKVEVSADACHNWAKEVRRH